MTRGCILLSLISVVARAYDPPVATAGPVTVRMQAPAQGSYGAGGFVELSRPGVAMSLPVELKSASDRQIRGTLRVKVIDRWTVEPAAPVSFTLLPRGRARHEFKLAFGPGTYNAHYPVHAYAEFEEQGRRYEAHAVLILETRIPDLERVKLPAEWKPVPVPEGGMLGLTRNPVRRERVEIASAGAEAGRVGREIYEAGSAVLYGPLAGEAGKQGITMALGPRPPSNREAVEAASVEYAVRLPAVKPLALESGIRGRGVFTVEAAPFDGGAFKIIAKKAGGAGEALRVGLERYAGKSIRLRLASPGGGGSRLLGTAGGCQVRLWPGSRGLLDAPVGLLCGDRKLYFRGFRVRSAGDDLELPR